jgi:hypothetical protein
MQHIPGLAIVTGPSPRLNPAGTGGESRPGARIVKLDPAGFADETSPPENRRTGD